MAIIRYRIEIWDPALRRYVVIWKGPYEYAHLMMYKPYYARHTRRLVRYTEEVLYQERGKR